MEKSTLIAIGIVAVLGPLLRYLLVLPIRKFSIWLAKVMPEGKLKRALLKSRGELKGYEMSRKLPPPPYQ